jgi:hypothetical protein
MKIKSYNKLERAIVMHIMGLPPEVLEASFQLTPSAYYKKQISDNIKRGIAQAKLRKLPKQKEPSHE